MTDKQKLIHIRETVCITIAMLKTAPQEGYAPMLNVTRMFEALERDIDELIKQPADV